ARLETVRFASLVRIAREAVEPVRQDHTEGVPAISPRLADPAALEDDMVEPALGELVAVRQPRMAGTDHDRGDPLGSLDHETLLRDGLVTSQAPADPARFRRLHHCT